MTELHRLYDAVWLIDFEFSAPAGEQPSVACLVAREFFSDKLIRIFEPELQKLNCAPFPVDDPTLVVAYFASAEWSCFLSLGWPLPSRILDLFAEFRNLTNGRGTVAGNGLVGAMAHFGLDSIGATEKQDMRELAIRGGPFTDDERAALLDYCQTDVDALARLLPAMVPQIDLPRALLRGRYTAAIGRMEHNGIPINTNTLRAFRNGWDYVKDQLIADVDRDYGVFDGQTFKQAMFAKWLRENKIPWPRTAIGRLALDDETFRQQSRRYPQVAPLRELRHSLSELRLEKLAVGSDGRNRCLLSPFSARTGRNQPSNNKFIFGPSVWLRGLIQPQPDMAVAYCDWSQQELGIAAALSDDLAMAEAYQSGDPYLAFAKQASAVPQSATKLSHPIERGQFKVCALAVQYGMGEFGLAAALNESLPFAQNLLRTHRETYPQFWQWSQSQVDIGMLRGYMQTMFGWRCYTATDSNPRSLGNFPMQASGAEMMRLAACLLTEAGIRVCCPIHDAFLVEAPADEIDAVVIETQRLMKKASRIVLNGFELESDAKIVRYPDQYCDEGRGHIMWEKVTGLILQGSVNDELYAR